MLLAHEYILFYMESGHRVKASRGDIEMRFTQEKVKWELRGMMIGEGNEIWCPIDEAERLSKLHDESKDFWTVECAADEVLRITQQHNTERHTRT